MTMNFVKRKPAIFFTDKKAVVKVAQENIGGQKIAAGTEVVITSKSRDLNWCLNIKDDSGIVMNNVSCEALELIK